MTKKVHGAEVLIGTKAAACWFSTRPKKPFTGRGTRLMPSRASRTILTAGNANGKTSAILRAKQPPASLLTHRTLLPEKTCEDFAARLEQYAGDRLAVVV